MTNTLEFKRLSKNATMPTRDRLDAGYDIYSAETLILEPQEKAVIKTDVAVNIPEGYVGLLTSKSGVSSKTHLVIETGKIDAGFQGSMGINIKNDIELTTSDEYMYEDIKGEIIDVEEFNESFGEQKLNPLEKFKARNISYVIEKGDKLAQLVIVPIWTPELKEVKEFSYVSERGTDGWGSTGY
ncbi:dUTP diphosphatase [Staphylococcus caprae]|uniref:dUTP diphosphatase n=1 Tax=Staphylococcus caprae TaxID=29380 RepID=UPI003B20CAD4